ncbi:MAG: DUF3857 domain-containing protein [Bacteroidia bacterium]
MHIFDKVKETVKFYRNFYFLIFILLVPAPSQAQRDPVLRQAPSSWIRPVPSVDGNGISNGDVSNGYVYTLYDIQTNLETQETYVHEVRKILNDKGVENGSELTIDLDPDFEKCTFHKLIVTRDGKAMDRTSSIHFKSIQPEKEINNHIYSGAIQAIAFLEDIRKGDVIEYSYTFRGFNPVFLGKFSRTIYFESSDVIPRIYQRIVLSSSRKIYFKNYLNVPEPVVSTIGNLTEYVWEKTNVPAKRSEKQLPKWYDAYANVQMSEFKDWKELKSWAEQLFHDNTALSKNVLNRIREFQHAFPDTADQLIAILRFVQNEIRYTGIETGEYSHRPQSPNKVFEQRYGDCKGKSVLLCRMLNEIGVRAYPALVDAYAEGHVSELLPSPSDFNHCITTVHFRDSVYWFDPTISGQHGTLRHIYCPDYGKALVIGDDSESLSTIPVSPPGNINAEELFLVGDTLQLARLIVTTVYSGSDADDQRERLSGSSLDEVRDLYLNYYGKLYDQISSSAPIEISDDTIANKLTVIESYEIGKMWSRPDSTKNEYKAGFTAGLFSEKFFDPGSVKRTMPIGLAHPVNIFQTIKIVTPGRWSIEEENIPSSNEWFRSGYKAAYSGDTIVLSYFYASLKDAVPVNRIDDYVKAVQIADANESYSLSWNPSAAAETTGEYNWIMISMAIVFTVLFFIIARIIRRHDIQVSMNPPALQLGGWLWLVLLGLVLTPLRLLIEIFSNAFFSQRAWAAITDPANPMYHALFGPLLMMELIGNMFVTFMAVFALILMIERRTIFPRVMIVYLASYLLFIILDSILGNFIPAVAENSSAAETAQSLGRTIVYAGIWIPYMVFSSRVKQTFILPYNYSEPTSPHVHTVAEGTDAEVISSESQPALPEKPKTDLPD